MGSVKVGFIDAGGYRRIRKGSFGGSASFGSEYGASCCNQWGLCCVVV